VFGAGVEYLSFEIELCQIDLLLSDCLSNDLAEEPERPGNCAGLAPVECQASLSANPVTLRLPSGESRTTV